MAIPVPQLEKWCNQEVVTTSSQIYSSTNNCLIFTGKVGTTKSW